jgi:hypothetical protein
LFDDVLTLEKGTYIAHYVTDGSHALEDVESPAAVAAYLWGLTVLVETAEPVSRVRRASARRCGRGR